MPNPVLRKRLIGDSSTLDPIVFDWVYVRVPANGGSVSKTTVKAVNVFTRTIRKAGLLPKILRLNLFCGDQFAACKVPLIKIVGDATDANTGNFNYTEVGSGAGPSVVNVGNEYLSTGVIPSTTSMGDNDAHLAVYETNNTSEASISIGFQNLNSTSQSYYLAPNYAGVGSHGIMWSAASSNNYPLAAGDLPGGGFYILTRTSSANVKLYKAGSLLATSVAAAGSRPDTGNGVVVFGLMNGTTFSSKTLRHLGGYSMGLGLNATDASNFSTAWQVFQTALARQV